LHVNDELGLFEATAQTGILRLQALVLLGQRIGYRLAATLPRRQCSELALFALAPPGGQMGRVQPFAAQQGSKGALIATGFRLLDNRALVLGSELAALRLGRDFGSGMGTGAAPPESADPSLRLGSLRSTVSPS
jgi:hypothetical protein